MTHFLVIGYGTKWEFDSFFTRIKELQNEPKFKECGGQARELKLIDICFAKENKNKMVELLQEYLSPLNKDYMPDNYIKLLTRMSPYKLLEIPPISREQGLKREYIRVLKVFQKTDKIDKHGQEIL